MSSSTELKNVHFACKGKQIAHFAKKISSDWSEWSAAFSMSVKKLPTKADD